MVNIIERSGILPRFSITAYTGGLLIGPDQPKTDRVVSTGGKVKTPKRRPTLPFVRQPRTAAIHLVQTSAGRVRGGSPRVVEGTAPGKDFRGPHLPPLP